MYNISDKERQEVIRILSELPFKNVGGVIGFLSNLKKVEETKKEENKNEKEKNA